MGGHVLQALLGVLDGADVGKRHQQCVRNRFTRITNWHDILGQPHRFARFQFDRHDHANRWHAAGQYLLRWQRSAFQQAAIFTPYRTEICAARRAHQLACRHLQDALGAGVARQHNALARLQDDALVEALDHRAIPPLAGFQIAFDLILAQGNTDQVGDVVNKAQLMRQGYASSGRIDRERPLRRPGAVENRRRPARTQAVLFSSIAELRPARISRNVADDDPFAKVDGTAARAHLRANGSTFDEGVVSVWQARRSRHAHAQTFRFEQQYATGRRATDLLLNHQAHAVEDGLDRRIESHLFEQMFFQFEDLARHARLECHAAIVFPADAQRFGGGLAIGDVAGDHLDRRTAVVLERRRTHFDVDHGAVEAPVTLLHQGRRFARSKHLTHPGAGLGRVVIVQDSRQRHANDVILVRRPQLSQAGFVDKHQCIVLDHVHGIGRELHERFITIVGRTLHDGRDYRGHDHGFVIDADVRLAVQSGQRSLTIIQLRKISNKIYTSHRPLPKVTQIFPWTRS